MKNRQTSHNLRDRTLWVDGSTSIHSATLSKMLLRQDAIDLSKIYVKEINNEVKNFNKLTGFNLSIKTKVDDFSTGFTIPDEYKRIDLKAHIFNLLYDETSRYQYTESEIDERIERVFSEYEKIRELNLEMLFKTMIFLIDLMNENKVVWGVGRGSSCASYILYLMDLHKVDPVKYGIDHLDFFRT